MSSLQQEIESSFGGGPEHPPVEVRVAAGRRALRRRRLGAAAGTLAVVAALGTGYAVSTAGTAPQTSGDVATDPTPTTSSTPEPQAPPPEEPWEGGVALRYVDGELEIRPGVTVHEHIENPYDYQPPHLSDALDITFQGQRVWAIVEKRKNGSSYSAAEPSNGWASFADYVADQADATSGGDDGWPDTFALTAAGQVAPTPGTTVHNRTDDPRLGPTFAPAGATVGAAVVTVEGDDNSYFVVWRVLDGELDVITTPPRDVVGATFEELLSFARSKYASGEGLR